MSRDLSILPVLDPSTGQPRDGLLCAWAGHPPRVVASAARVAGGPCWVVVGFGAASGVQMIVRDVRAGLVHVWTRHARP